MASPYADPLLQQEPYDVEDVEAFAIPGAVIKRRSETYSSYYARSDLYSALVYLHITCWTDLENSYVQTEHPSYPISHSVTPLSLPSSATIALLSGAYGIRDL